MKQLHSTRLLQLSSYVLGLFIFLTSCTKETLQVTKSDENLLGSTISSNAYTDGNDYSLGYNNHIFVIFSPTNANLVLDVPNASKQNGTIIQQYQHHGGTNQQWWVLSQPGGYLIMNMNSGKNLDVPNGSLAPGVKIQQYQQNVRYFEDGTNVYPDLNQLWKIEPLNTNGTKVIIRNAKSGLPLTVTNNSTSSGAQIQQSLPFGLNQVWYIMTIGNYNYHKRFGGWPSMQ